MMILKLLSCPLAAHTLTRALPPDQESPPWLDGSMPGARGGRGELSRCRGALISSAVLTHTPPALGRRRWLRPAGLGEGVCGSSGAFCGAGEDERRAAASLSLRDWCIAPKLRRLRAISSTARRVC